MRPKSKRMKGRYVLADVEVGMMISIYIPDYARVYEDVYGYRISEYFCILLNS